MVVVAEGPTEEAWETKWEAYDCFDWAFFSPACLAPFGIFSVTLLLPIEYQ